MRRAGQNAALDSWTARVNGPTSTKNAPDDQRLIHVVDDDEGMRDALSMLLRMRGYRVATYPSAVTFLEARPPAAGCCLITDVQMPDMTGIEMMQALRDSDTGYPTIVLCGRPTPQIEASVRALGARAFMAKPFDPAALSNTINGLFADA